MRWCAVVKRCRLTLSLTASEGATTSTSRQGATTSDSRLRASCTVVPHRRPTPSSLAVVPHRRPTPSSLDVVLRRCPSLSSKAAHRVIIPPSVASCHVAANPCSISFYDAHRFKDETVRCCRALSRSSIALTPSELPAKCSGRKEGRR